MPEQGNSESGLKRLTAALGSSAEYSIAAGLIIVCLAVGGTLFLLDGERKPASNAVATAAPALDSAKIAAEEKAALDGWNQQLQGDFKNMEQSQRKAAEEQAARDRQRMEAERAERAAAELERQQRAQAAAKVAAKVVARVEPKIDWTGCRRPEYPSSSVKRREEGVVVVDVSLDAKGKVLGSKVAESSGFAKLDTVTQRAIEKCDFSPATVDGVAQPASALVRFAWKLQ